MRTSIPTSHTDGTETITTVDGTTLKAWGLAPGPAFALILESAPRWLSELTIDQLKDLLASTYANPRAYAEHALVADVAAAILASAKTDTTIPLRDEPLAYTSYGAEHIEGGARQQMNTAMRLPRATAGALMPDAHQGYGLPIGGVLAADNAVIPYAVGVDIGCRMCLSVFGEPVELLTADRERLVKLLQRNTYFGRQTSQRAADHSMQEDERFGATDLLRGLRDRARRQLGSSGGGNHFVEWGVVTITEHDPKVGLATGEYLGLLNHSGSRGLGATVANHYTKLAMAETPLPDEARHLAWLDLDTAAGAEYWAAMNLAGDYASACHHVIHDRMAIGLRAKPLARIENHHNFAWRELDADGVERIVHRKGATPAGAGVLGIIPGSMTAPGFIVRGRGEAASLASASHGAGRQMSRTAAKKTIARADWAAQLQAAGVTLLGAGLDEAPDAYKDIHAVMAAQVELVDVLGAFRPQVVRMCGDSRFREVD